MKSWGNLLVFALASLSACLLISQFKSTKLIQKKPLEIFGPAAPAPVFAKNKTEKTEYGEICLNAAYNLCEERRFQEALFFCREAHKYSPYNADYQIFLSSCLNEIGIEYFKSANYVEALHNFEESNIYNSTDSNTKYNIIQTIKMLGYNPNSWQDRVNLANKSLDFGNELSAIVELREACRLRPEQNIEKQLELLEKKNDFFSHKFLFHCWFARRNQDFYASLGRKVRAAWHDKKMKRGQSMLLEFVKDPNSNAQGFRVYLSGEKQIDSCSTELYELLCPLDFEAVEYYGCYKVTVPIVMSTNSNTVVRTKKIKLLEQQQSLCKKTFLKGKQLF